MRIMVLDPQPVVREGLRSGLSASGEFLIVGSCGDIRSALRMVDQAAPEVIVMDLDVGAGDGGSSVRELRRLLPTGGVLVFPPRLCWRTLGAARRAGAAGVVLKTDPLDTVAEAIRVVGQGGSYLSRSLPSELRESLDQAPDVLTLLSGREREVFYLVIRGLTNRRIGRELFISPKTVDSHRGRILDKLGCRSAVELVRFAYLNGLLPDAPQTNGQTDVLLSATEQPPPQQMCQTL
jgi:two-component system, NarL family, response regulator NreC